MRVLLLSTPATFDGIEPIGLMYLSVALKTAGHQAKIFLVQIATRLP